MAILSKGTTFADADQITSTKLNNLVDNATFDANAVDGTTMQLVAGKLAVNVVETANINTSAVTATRLATDSVIEAKIQNSAVTANKIASDAVTTAKILDANVTTAKIADANVTAPKLSGAQTGSAPIYGVRAWVVFNPSGTILASGNVTSVTKIATGKFKIIFPAFSDVNYAAVATAGGDASNGRIISEYGTRLTTEIYFLCSDDSGGTADPIGYCSVMFLR